MTDSTTFSTRSNAKRAAEKSILDGSGPSVDYGIKALENGRFEIVWHTGADKADAEAAPEAPEVESTEEVETIEEDGEAEVPKAAPRELPDPFPPGTRVVMSVPGQINKKHFQSGTIERRVTGSRWEVSIDGTDGLRQVFTGGQLSLPEAEPEVLTQLPEAEPEVLTQTDLAAPARRAKRDRGPGAAPSGGRANSVELDAAASRGEMPIKPIMTSKANPGYQARFDKLEAWALAGDWDAVRGYEVNGINSYAKMVKQYRERLLTAHAASAERSSEAA